MEHDDKPFACSFTGCNQKFVTEDKLALHMQKHEFNLDGLPVSLFPDQTPTPTTFLRDCENIALFQDLGVKNPFDESFRKAVIDPNSTEIVDADGLDTPSILPDTAMVLGLINTPTSSVREKPSFLKMRSTLVTPTSDRCAPNFVTDNLDTPTFDINSTAAPIFPSISYLRRSISGTRSKLVDSSISSSSTNQKTTSNSTVSKNAKATTASLLTSTTASSLMAMTASSLMAAPISSLTVTTISNGDNPNHITSAVSSSSLQEYENTNKLLVNSKSIVSNKLPASKESLVNYKAISTVQTSERLRNGIPFTGKTPPLSLLQSVAFIVPAKPTVSNTCILPLMENSNASLINTTHILPTTSRLTQPSAGDTENTETSSIVKQRLKQALKKEGMTPLSTNQLQVSVAEVPAGQQMSFNTPLSADSSSSNEFNNKRALSPSEDELHDDKRLKTLERNRDAARRCRKKKKIFIQGLEEKLKQAHLLNSHLVNENTRLKLEITELKSLFLDHKDCDVTRKQMSSGLLDNLIEKPRTAGEDKSTQKLVLQID